MRLIVLKMCVELDGPLVGQSASTTVCVMSIEKALAAGGQLHAAVFLERTMAYEKVMNTRVAT